MTRTTITLLLLLLVGTTFSQYEEMVAYVPSKAPARTADDTRITFMDPVIPGTVEVSLPAGTHRVDLLNSRGRVKYSKEVSTYEQLDLRKLRRGTWTLRAHTGSGMAVRRFLVMGRGHVLWEIPGRSSRRHR